MKTMPINRPARMDLNLLLTEIDRLSKYQFNILEEDVRLLINLVTNLFRMHLFSYGYIEEQVRPLCTKFRDAGRRSAPWKPFSTRVPGRPQDGADGNRILRWKLQENHKFYASEVDGTLVEVKYYLQALSMADAPDLPPNSLQTSFHWLLNHSVIPGTYLDPIQLIPISLVEFIRDPRLVQSGHLIPLDRDGKHIPSNTFLMLARSNQIQGNQTVEEMVALMEQIVQRHKARQGH